MIKKRRTHQNHPDLRFRHTGMHVPERLAVRAVLLHFPYPVRIIHTHLDLNGVRKLALHLRDMGDEEIWGEWDSARAERRNTIGFIGIVKIYLSRNQKPGNLPDQSTYPQYVSKKAKIFDTSSWL